jgi:phage terminase large subunit
MLLRYIRDDIRKSIWKDFIDRLTERNRLHEYKISLREMTAIHLETKNELNATGVKASAQQTAKLKSIAGFTHVVMEEADEIPKENKTKLIDSVRKKGVKIQIIEMFNVPRKTHYIWDDYNLIPTEHDGYFMADPKQSSGITSIHSNYIVNKHNLNDKYLQRYNDQYNSVYSGIELEKLKYALTDVHGLIPSGNTGSIYVNWKRISVKDYEELGLNAYYGLDWGTRDPCAIIEGKFKERKAYFRGLNYKPLQLLDIAIFLANKGFSPSDLIVCDSAEPASILQLRNGYSASDVGIDMIRKYPAIGMGFYCVPVGNKRIEEGINSVKEYEVFIVDDEESNTIWNEMLGYVWMLDKDGKPSDKPSEKDNHYMDVLRYLCVERGKLF